MSNTIGALCVLAALVIPIWTLIRFSDQARQARLIQAELDDLRLALAAVERALLDRIASLEAQGAPAGRRVPVTAAPVPAVVSAPVRRVTIAAPLAPVERVAPPPVVPEPPLDEPLPEAPRRNLERTMVWVIAAVGGGAVALSGLIFFASALASGAIPPGLRVLMGLVLGGAAMACGEVLWRGRSSGAGAALAGAGAGLLHGALYAGAIRYGLLPIELAFVLMSGVTGLTAWRADHHRSALLAGLSLLAGFATPLMLSTGESRPVLLIGYLALLNAGLLACAIRRQWRGLIAGSGALTLLMVSGWAVRFLDPGQLPVAVIGAGLLCAVFLLAASWRREPGEADRLAGLVGTLLGGMAPVLMLTQGVDPLPLAGVLAVWIAGATGAGSRRGWGELSLTAAWLSVAALLAAALLVPGPSAILAAMLLASAGLLAALLRGALRWLALPGLIAGVIGAVLTVSGPLSASPLLLIELLGLGILAGAVAVRREQPWLVDVTGLALVALASVSGMPLLTGGVLAVAAGLGARACPRAGLWAPALGAAGLALPLVLSQLTPIALVYLLGLAGLGAGLGWSLKRGDIALLTAALVGGLQVMMAAVGLVDGPLPSTALLLLPPLVAAVSTRREAIAGSYIATLISGGLLLSATPQAILIAPAILGVGLALLSPVTLPLAVLYGSASLLALEASAPGLRLVLAWGLTLAAWAMPMRRNDRITHQTAILAGSALFLPAHLAWQELTGGALGGLQPALVAGLTLAAAIRARRAEQATGVAEVLVLGFATAAVVIQLAGPWLVLGLSAELVALAELQRRQHLPLLRFGALALAGAVFVLLLSPIMPRPAPLVWTLPAAALLWSGERLRGWSVRPAQGVQLGGALLLFAAQDRCVLGLFGGDLHVASLAGQMVRSLAWGGYGLALMGTGVRLRRKPVRLLALIFLCLAAGKVFLADLWQLHGLVRVGSIMGLGVFLLVAAVLLQRVVLSESEPT